jgi:hypothetical protein
MAAARGGTGSRTRKRPRIVVFHGPKDPREVEPNISLLFRDPVSVVDGRSPPLPRACAACGYATTTMNKRVKPLCGARAASADRRGSRTGGSCGMQNGRTSVNREVHARIWEWSKVAFERNRNYTDRSRSACGRATSGGETSDATQSMQPASASSTTTKIHRESCRKRYCRESIVTA